MTTTLRLSSIARMAVLSVALAFPVATSAYADGDFNISRDNIDLQSAATGSPFKSVRDAARQREYDRLASTVPMVGGKRDLVGNGGHQDNLANEIYQPGHTVGVGE